MGIMIWYSNYLITSCLAKLNEVDIPSLEVSPPTKELHTLLFNKSVFNTSELIWVILIISVLLVVQLKIGLLLLASCFLVIIFSLLFAQHTSALVTQVLPSAILFLAAYFSTIDIFSAGSVLFVMITGTRLISATHSIVQGWSDVRNFIANSTAMIHSFFI